MRRFPAQLVAGRLEATAVWSQACSRSSSRGGGGDDTMTAQTSAGTDQYCPSGGHDTSSKESCRSSARTQNTKYCSAQKEPEHSRHSDRRPMSNIGTGSKQGK